MEKDKALRVLANFMKMQREFQEANNDSSMCSRMADKDIEPPCGGVRCDECLLSKNAGRIFADTVKALSKKNLNNMEG